MADKTLDINSGGGDIEITKVITGTDGDEILVLDVATGTTGIVTLGGNVGNAAGLQQVISSQ